MIGNAARCNKEKIISKISKHVSVNGKQNILFQAKTLYNTLSFIKYANGNHCEMTAIEGS